MIFGRFALEVRASGMEIALPMQGAVFRMKSDIMMILSAIVVTAGCLTVCVAHAGAVENGDSEGPVQPSSSLMPETGGGSSLPGRLSVSSSKSNADPLWFAEHSSEFTASYQRSPNSGVIFGYMGLPGEPALGPPVSNMRRYAGIDNPEAAFASHWLDSSYRIASVLTLGYTWRDVRVEGSAFSAKDVDGHRVPRNEAPKLDSRAARLSFNPSPEWSIQFSRGALSGLDQMIAAGDVRRTTLSATYQRLFDDGNWQTTLAWGRNSRKFRESTMGYLLESTLRFGGTHIVFGRFEQIGSDELLRENESLQRQAFKMGKVTLGYFRDLPANGPLKLDVGVLASRHLVPSQVAPSYGRDPTTVMLFVRLNLR